MPEFHPGILSLIQTTIIVLTISGFVLMVVSFLIAAVIKVADE
jgi:hypothetical protein